MEKGKWEKLVSRFPDDDIPCKDCVYRLPEIEVNGKVYIQYKKATCEAFKHMKPHEVLWDHAECPFYEEDVRGKAIDDFIKEYGAG